MNWRDLGEAAKNGAVDAYMWGGIGAAAQGIAGWYQAGSTTAQYIDDTYKAADNVIETSYANQSVAGLINHKYLAFMSRVVNQQD